MRLPGQKRQLVLGVNVPIRIVLQQRVIVVLFLVPVLRGATRRMMASIRRRIGWGHNATSCEVVSVRATLAPAPTTWLYTVRATLHPDAPAALELSIARTRVLDYL